MAAFLLSSKEDLLVNIFELKHRNQTLFFLIIEAARAIELFRILVSSKQHVPPDNVSIVIQVTGIFVMDAMHLRPLKEVTHLTRCLYVRVIEKLPDRRAKRIDCASLQAES